AEAIAEMRALLRERGTVSNRDFEMASRTRTQSYRGRKDSALSLYYLWRTGEVMTHHRENFERVYALTETVAPASLMRESEEAETDRFLISKEVSFYGLSRLPRTSDAFHGRGEPDRTAKKLLGAMVADGDLIEVQVEGWKMVHYALGSDAEVLAEVSAGRVPQAWTPLETTTTQEVVFLAPLDHVSAGEPKQSLALTTSGRSTSLSTSAGSATTRCRCCGATGSSRASTANSTGRPTHASSWACGWRMRLSAPMRHLPRHWLVGWRAS
ncbi:MAG: winged helix DNA-binding domain-containing protein, partial [Chloroflexi bacterium]